MILNTHLLIADYVSQYVYKNTGFKLIKKNFRYGNIKPDISLSLSKYDHNYNGSISLILDMITELKTIKMTDKLFSEKLGIINHFISDYFCSYHSYIYLKRRNILEHLFYEVALHYKLKKKIFDGYKNTFKKSLSDVNELINYFINKYYSNKRSLYNDIYYAINATSAITTLIIEECLKINKTNKQAA